MLIEGSVVSWVGTASPTGVGVGDKGTVVSSSGGSGHVQWTTGARRGEMHLVEEWDVVPAPGATTHRMAVSASLNDSLGVNWAHTAAREAYDDGGPATLLSAMHEHGDLSCFPSIAEGAVDFVAARLREDPKIAATLAALDDTEVDSLVTLASTVLLRDAFTNPEDD